MAQDIYVLDNLVIPRGIVYFDPFNASGVETGEIDLGETGGATISTASESLQYYSSRSKVREKTRDTQTSIDRTANLTIDNISPYNLSMFVVADLSVVTQSATPVVAEPFTALKGRSYQLGKSAPVRNVTAVVVKIGAAVQVLNTDYTLDAANGRITILTAGAIADNAAITVDYTPAAETRNAATAATAPKKGALRVIADTFEGRNNDWWFPSVVMKPTGDMPLLSADDAWQQMAFEIGIQKRSGYPLLKIFDRAVG